MATGEDGKPLQRRVIRTKPHVNYEAGDRTGVLPEVIDLDFSKFVEAFAVQQPSPEPLAARPVAAVPAPAPKPTTAPGVPTTQQKPRPAAATR